ncbi:solute carrier family 13 member 5 [Cyclospora cayetanensis]|uniref:Solute carrier family 13 member 5 n=1 Tax=Cyclospora cayetanensis TaxID=88456 RepID=A0A6P5WEX9_9EIME|nr:solute carrier family 13 member 5 [Cyclospora cayetanensis]
MSGWLFTPQTHEDTQQETDLNEDAETSIQPRLAATRSSREQDAKINFTRGECHLSKSTACLPSQPSVCNLVRSAAMQGCEASHQVEVEDTQPEGSRNAQEIPEQLDEKAREEMSNGLSEKCLPLRGLFVELVAIVSCYRQLLRTAASFCLPLLIFVGWSAEDDRSRCLYVILVMVLCWLSNCMDAYTVALLPFVLFPVLHVAPVGDVASSYMNSVSFLIFGASMMAAALRRVKLDVATANWLCRISPKHPEDLALCLMATCFAISTCLSNTGTMLIFCPIIDLMVQGLHPEPIGSEPARIDSRESRNSHHSFTASLSKSGPLDHPAGSDGHFFYQEEPPLLPLSHRERSFANAGDMLNYLHASEGQGTQGEAAARVCSIPVSLDKNGLKPTLPRPSCVPSSTTESIVEQNDVLDRIAAKIQRESPDLSCIRRLLFIGCAYAATLGGSVTVTGATSNAIFLAVLDAMYATMPGGSATNPVTYTTWLLVSLPLGVVQLLLVWLSLCALWMGPRATGRSITRIAGSCLKLLQICRCKRRGKKATRQAAVHASEGGSDAHNVVRPSFAEAPGPQAEATKRARASDGLRHCAELYWARVYVVVAWLLLVCLWLSRRTILAAVPGWGAKWEGSIDDSWPAVLVPMCLGFAPLYPRRSAPSFARAASAAMRWRNRRRRRRRLLCGGGAAPTETHADCSGSGHRQDRFEGILTFALVEKEMDWGLLFLLGSGFVVASVSHACGLDKVMIENMDFLTRQSKAGQVACIMAMAGLVTQVTSNTATASILMPLLSTAAKGLPGNPLLLMLAANFATTLGFLLPVSTASNAVIVRFTRIRTWQFFLSGLLPLALCLGVAYVATFTWVAAVFGLIEPYPNGKQVQQ